LISAFVRSIAEKASPKALAKASLQNPMIQSALVQSIESTISHALKHDVASQRKLAAQSGKSIQVRIGKAQSETWLVINLLLEADSVRINFLDDDLAIAADAVLTGSGSEFASLAMNDDKVHALMNGDIDVAGNSSLVLELAKISDHLDIDWEAVIQPVTGGLIAHAIGKTARNSKRWAKDSGATLKVASKSYLEDEAEILVPAPLAEDFYQQVSDAQLRADRLAAKIEHLAAQINKKK